MKRFILGCVAAASLLAVSPALADDVPVSEEAREKFRAGVALLQDPDGARTEEAYLAFKAAYAISPSPNILGNLGLCAMRLERDEEAINAYTTYLEKGSNIEAGERQQIESDLKTLKNTLSRLELKIDPGQAQILDERQPSVGPPIKNRYGPAPAEGLKLGLRAGRHRITVALDGYREQTFEIELSPGKTETKAIKLEAASTLEEPKPDQPKPPEGEEPDVDRPVPVSVWAMLGVTGALAVGAGVVGALAVVNKSDYDETNNGSDPAASQDLRDKGVAMNITTDVLIGASAASAVVTLVLFLTRPEVEVENKSGVSVTFVPTGTGAALVGTF
ncbi:MAG: hypothetical protein HOW73_01715 [Polyangiaceae bacterium]|nr:hypothetical protein [Polyangiaceae bacterium]